MSQEEPSVTVADLASKLGITKQALWGLVRRGVVKPPSKVSERKHMWMDVTAKEIVAAREMSRANKRKINPVYRHGYVDGVVFAMNSIFLDKADENEMIDYLFFVSDPKNRGKKGEIPSLEQFREHMGKERGE